MFQALVTDPRPPSPESAGLQSFAHEPNDIFLPEAGPTLDFLERNAIRPCSPDNPILAVPGGLGVRFPGFGRCSAFHGSSSQHAR